MHHPVRRQIWSALLTASLLAASCAAPASTPVGPTPAPASPGATTGLSASQAPSSPAAASPLPASPAAATPGVSSQPTAPGASPSPSTAPPTASASPAAAPKASPSALDPNQLFLTVVDANAAYARRDLATALRLYDQAAEASLPPGTGPPGQDLRAFARFRYLVASTVDGQEDQARAALETARAEDGATPFPGLGQAFWEIYSLTADPAAACRRVNDLVAEQPGAVARSLSSWGSGNAAVSPEQVCQLPGS
jgi:hypothetical protein